MKTRLALALAVSCLLAPFATRAENEIGFIEKFALAPDREAVLDQLVPGTEDYYAFHALQYQNTRQAAKLKALLEQWAKRYPSSGSRNIIENRAALLGYDTDPKATLKFLIDRLHLEFNHEQVARDQKPDLPTRLDPATISRAEFQRLALENQDGISQVNEGSLENLVRDKARLSPSQRRDLLRHLQRPDVPGLLDLIEADWNSEGSRGFGEFAIHRALLPEQLDELARRVPALYKNEQFVYERLRKLAPGADADAEFDPVEREAWLDRLWAYAKNLNGSFNSLKAEILLHRLEHDRARGVYDKARFQEFLKLPRRSSYVNVEFLRRFDQASQSDAHSGLWRGLGLLPQTHSEEELVRDYLLHLLKDEPTWEPWAAWLRDTWLKPVFAEAKIVNGVGDPEKWASLISPSAFQALKERVDVDFARSNPPFLAPADEVSLDLFLKNTPKLIVKIYEINAVSYFLANKKQLNTDLPLDGLVANREVTHDFSTDEAGRNPFRRNLRTFKFPELKGQRGAWVIEFIGGGKSSRALIRKGQWSALQRTGAAGDMITVLDEARQPVKDAVIWLEGRKYTPDEKTGAIIVPFTNQPGRKPIVLSDAAGNFATLADFEHHAENYRLDAQFHVEREQLLAGREATVAVRANLLLNDAHVPLDLLHDVKLRIVSRTLDNVDTTIEIPIEKLDPAKVFTHTIKVPDRLAMLELTLTAQVEKLSAGGAKETLDKSSALGVNGIDRLDKVRCGHFSRFNDEYVFELLGRNGEPVQDQPVNLEFTHRDFKKTVSVSLRTDEKGRISCGTLPEIADISAKVTAEEPEGMVFHWSIEEAGRTWPRSIHAAAGDTVELPWDGAWWRHVSLLEIRAGTFVADRSGAVHWLANGEPVPGGEGVKKVDAIALQGLAPGDYSLRIPGKCEIAIRITAGQAVQNWLLSPNRELEVREAEPLNIASVRRDGGALLVQLAHAGKFARVHVAATRFLPARNLFEDLGDFTRFDPAQGTPEKAPNLFAVGRAIGDEYRYILERRYAKLFPGNMLPRPGLLLNPWEVRSTDLQAQRMEGGQAADATRGGRAAGAKPAEPQRQTRDGKEITPELFMADLNFLAQSAPVLYNLVPDEKGVVRIDLKALGDRQYVQVYAEDVRSAVWRSVAMAETATKLQDLRLVRNLDPQKPFTEKKEITLLSTGQSLTLSDVLTADLETYDSLPGIFRLLATIHQDETLRKFEWIVRWPKLSDDEKRAKYSEFACHELNFFLSRKDPGFFQKVVLPYLRNKKDRTFMDDFLLGNDLHAYLEPWAFSRLNAVERCLLAQHLPGESAATARHEREKWELLTPDLDREDLLFEMALRGRALSAEDLEEFEKAKSGAEATLGAMRDLIPRTPGAAGAAEGAATSALAAPVAGAAPAAPAAAPLALRGTNTYTGAEVVSEAAKDMPKLNEAVSGAVTAGNRSGRLAISGNAVDAMLFPLEGEVRLQRAAVRQFFRALGPTKEWAENNYYQVLLPQQNADFITVNAFWRDYAAWDGKSPFVSANVTAASNRFAEMVLALAVLDLPFESPKHTTRAESGQFTLTAAGPLIAFHREIKPAAASPEHAPLLVSENFFRADDRFRQEGNEKFEKYVTDEFLSGVVYGANVVVTNPASAPQKVSVLLQIPRGALPVNGSKATDSRRLKLGPYSTQTLEYYFYFPSPAAQPLPHCPVHVALDEQVVGEAKPFAFKVVQQLSQIDKTSWDYVSQYGSEADVFEFLDKANIERIDLERVAWRARKSKEFFRKIVDVMEKRHVYSEPIYRYAIVHSVAGPLATWLRQHEDFVSQCGPYLDSKLLKIDPVERRSYEHLEYSPLVNQRAHRLGAENRIPNSRLREQYQGLMRILAHKPALEAADQMSVVYYLFLQDRVEEAIARFHSIAPEALPTRLQYDYLRCYVAFYEEQPGVARGLAQQYADYPVDRWRKLFMEVAAQLDEAEGKQPARPGDDQPNREKQQGELAATEPTFDFKVENRQIAITWKNLSEVAIRYYLMDPEFLFSASPFVTQDSSRFSIIKPTRADAQPLPARQDKLVIPLPPEFTKANVLVEILGAGQRKAQAYHANSLKLTVAENYGRLEVRDDAQNKPVAKAYVKVYARLHDGTVRFFKDGYTDLRGRFDYASLNSSESPAPPVPMPRAANPQDPGLGHYQMLTPGELNQVERFAILLLSDAHGADVREAAPPSQ